MKQSVIFLEGEGAAWAARNRNAVRNGDIILDVLRQAGIKASSSIEIGCGSGWRLDGIETHIGGHARGLDPGHSEPDGRIVRGTADDLDMFSTGSFDLVIYGFCLCWTDPDDYQKIASEGDRVLAAGGHLVVLDFSDVQPFKVPYKHREGMWTYHRDFAQLWAVLPGYELISRTDSGERAVTILKKAGHR